MSLITFRPIGIVHTSFQDPVGMPIQPAAGKGEQGKVILDPEFELGLQDLEGFSHLILIYSFHQAAEGKLLVTPFLDDQVRGVFSTRSPRRPNPIGISVVRLVRISGNILEIEDVDILDGTPVLDIKPYVPEFDPAGPFRIGWLEGKRGQVRDKTADDRFV